MPCRDYEWEEQQRRKLADYELYRMNQIAAGDRVSDASEWNSHQKEKEDCTCPQCINRLNKARLNQLSRDLCEACALLDSNNIPISGNLEKWWKKHQVYDAKASSSGVEGAS